MKKFLVLLMLGMFGVAMLGCEARIDEDGAAIEVND